MVKMAADEVEKALKTLPVDDLNQTVFSLQDIISHLEIEQSKLKDLEKTLKESQEEDVKEFLKEIEEIRIKIIYLISQSNIGLDRVMMAQGIRNKQGEEVQKFTKLFTELESWLENARNLMKQNMNLNNEQEILVLIQAYENLLKELRIKTQGLVTISTQIQEYERNPDLVRISASLKPRLDLLQKEFSQLDQLLKDRIDSLQEIHVVFINRDRKPDDQPVVKPLAATAHDQESKPTPIFVPKARKGDPLNKPDGSLTNVCRVEEAFTTFLPPQSTESTFKPIPMSESQKSQHKKPPIVMTESLEDPSDSLPDEYSAEQVSQKVFDFLEIDQPERDNTIDSRASPIPTEEIIDLDSPRFEYYEEIKFKKPVLYGQTRLIEKHEIYETDDLPEAEPEYKEYVDGKKLLIEEIEQPQSVRTHKYLIKGVDPKLVKEYKYVRIPTELEEPFDVSSSDQPLAEQIRQGSRTIVKTVRRRIIRKVVIINGVETVTEEVVEEPVEEIVSEFDQSDMEGLERNMHIAKKDEKEPKQLEYIKFNKKSDSSPSELHTADDELERRIRASVLRPQAKEFTPSSSFSLSSSGSPSLDSIQPSKLDFVVKETRQPLTETLKTKKSKKEDTPIDHAPKEDNIKVIKPQRKKRKKRRSEKTQEESAKIDDDFASGDEDEFEDTEESEKIFEDNNKCEKRSFVPTLIFGGKEKPSEEMKEDKKPKHKMLYEKTEETTLPTDKKSEKGKILKDKPELLIEDKKAPKSTEENQYFEETLKSNDSEKEKNKIPFEEKKDKGKLSEDKKQDRKLELREEISTDVKSKKYMDTITFLELEKSEMPEPEPEKNEKSLGEKPKLEDKKQSDLKGKGKEEKATEDLSKKGKELEKEEHARTVFEIFDRTRQSKPVKLTEKQKILEEPTKEEPTKKESEPEELEKTKEDQSKPMDKNTKFDKPIEKPTKKDKTLEGDKPTPISFTLTETVKLDEPLKEDFKKKDKKIKASEDKAKPAEITVIDSTPKIIGIETTELLKHEKAPDLICEEKEKLAEDPSERGNLEKNKTKPTYLKHNVEDRGAPKGVASTEEKPKEDSEKKGKTPDLVKPMLEDVKIKEEEQIKSNEIGKKPLEEPKTTDESTKEERKPEKEDHRKKKGKKEKSPEGRTEFLDKKESDLRKPYEPQVIIKEEKPKIKTSKDDEPTVTNKTSVGKPEDKSSKDALLSPADDAVKKGKSIQKGKTSEKDEPKLTAKITEITAFIEAEKLVEKPSEEMPSEIDEVKEIGRQLTFKDDKDKRKTPEKVAPGIEKITESIESEAEVKKPVENISKKLEHGKDIEPEKPMKDSIKKGKSPEEGPFKKNEKTIEEDKKSKEGRTIPETVKITEDEKPRDSTKKEKSFEKEPLKKDEKPVEDKRKPKDEITISEQTKFIESEKPETAESIKMDMSRKLEGKETILETSKSTETKTPEDDTTQTIKSPEEEKLIRKNDKFIEDVKKPKRKTTDVEEISIPEFPTKDEKPLQDCKKTDISITKILDIEKPEEKTEKKGKPPGKEKSLEKESKNTVVEKTEMVEPEKPCDDSVKKGKSLEQDELSKKDDQELKDKTISEITTFIETEKPDAIEPFKKENQFLQDDKKPKDKSIKPAEFDKPDLKEQISKEDRLRENVKKQPNDKKPDDKAELSEQEKPNEELYKSVKSSEEKKPSQKPMNEKSVKTCETLEHGKSVEDVIKKPKDTPTVLKITQTDKPEEPVNDAIKKQKDKKSFDLEKPKEIQASELVISNFEKKTKLPGKPMEKEPSKFLDVKNGEKPDDEKRDFEDVTKGKITKEEKPSDKKTFTKPVITDESKDDTKKEKPISEEDKLKSTNQKIFQTAHCLEREKSPREESAPEKGESENEIKRKTPEETKPESNLAVRDTTALLNYEITFREASNYKKTTDVVRKEEKVPEKEEPLSTETAKTTEESGQIRLEKKYVIVEPEKDDKKKDKEKKLPEGSKTKSFDKKFSEIVSEVRKPDPKEKAKTPEKEQPSFREQTPTTETPDQKSPKIEKSNRETSKKRKTPEKEERKTTEKRTPESAELQISEKDSLEPFVIRKTKPTEDFIKREKLIDKIETPLEDDKSVPNDGSKEPSKSDKVKSKLEKDILDTTLLLEKEKFKPKEDKHIDVEPNECNEKQNKSKITPSIKSGKLEESEDSEKKDQKKLKKDREPKKETITTGEKAKGESTFEKPDDDSTKSQTLVTEQKQPLEKIEDKASEESGIVKKDDKSDSKKQQPDKKLGEETQKIEVIVSDKQSEDRRFREIPLQRIDRLDDTKEIVGKDKGDRKRRPENETRKHIDNSDIVEKSQKQAEKSKKPIVLKDKESKEFEKEDIEETNEQRDQVFIQEETKKQKEPKDREPKGRKLETKENEITKNDEQLTGESSTIAGTLVSMAKSLFGFGGSKKPTSEDKRSEDLEEEKKTRKRKGKKKGLEIDEEIEDEEEKIEEEVEEDTKKKSEDSPTEKPVTKPARSKKKAQAGEEEEIEESTVEKGEPVPQKPGRKRKAKIKGLGADEEEENVEIVRYQQPEQQDVVRDATPGWNLPSKELQIPETEKTILFRYDPSDPEYQKSMDHQPQHGVMPAPVEPEKKSDAKDSKKAVEEISDEILKPSAPTYADMFVQTSSPETSPRVDKLDKVSPSKGSETTEKGFQTETYQIDKENQTNQKIPFKDVSDKGKQTTEKSQQTSSSFQDIGTSPQIFSPEDSSTETEKLTEKKQPDKKPRKPKTGDKLDGSEPIDSKSSTKPGEKSPDDSFDVHVTAKVSVTQPDVPTRSKKGDKKERKRKWKDQPDEEKLEDVEVSSTISVQTPRDLIEAERVSIDVKPTPRTEVSINVKPKEKFVTEFLDSERKFTKEEPEDSESKKSKKGKKSGKDREDTFSKRESGMPLRRDSSPSGDEISEEDKNKKYGIGVDVRVEGEKPDFVKRKPKDEDKYKVSVDVKVKSDDIPKPSESTGRVEIGTNIPSPRDVEKDTDSIEPKELALVLQKTSDLGRNRVKKIQNMKGNRRVMTFMIPTYQSVPQESIKKNIKIIENDVANLRDALSKNDHAVIRRIFVYLIKNIDDWLETVEYRIVLNRQNSNEGPNRDKVNELKSLKEEIGEVKNNMTYLLKDVKKIPTSDDSDVIYQLKTYIEELEPQISEIQDMTETEQEAEIKNLSRWEEFLNGVNNLSVLVEEIRQNLDAVIDSDGSANIKLQELEKIETANRDYSDRAVNLINMAKDMASEFPNQEIPSETYTTFETTRIIQSNLNTERERLLQLISLADEYEQTLKEFAQVVEVADNIVESPITITSLDHLQDEMQKHRKFFVNLSHCRAILESLEGNLDEETRGTHNHLHRKLHAKASSILDKAASRAQQMAMAASRWTVLDKDARNEQKWLKVAHQRLPDLQQVMSLDYDQYISLYQSLASDTAIHHAKVLQLVDVANKLQDIVTCVGLEKFHDDYLNVILKLQEEIQSRLEKLLAFQTMWTLYEIMVNKLSVWMKTTEEDLKNLKAVPGRASMRQFWELKAQYEVHNRLRQEMGSNFEKAVQFLPIDDEMNQRQILGKLEDRWKKLENEIKEIQDSAMATLSAQDVPVNEKLKLLEDELNELNDTVDDLHGVIKTDEELNLYIERLQVLSGRLETIQEELGRLGLLPAAESEKVGYLLGLGRRLELQLMEELHESVALREKLLALQKGLDKIKRNQNSVSSLLDQCEVAETMGSDMVEQAVTSCENISSDLLEQWQDMMNLRQVLHTLPMRLRLTVSPIKVEREISQLQEVHIVLEERCRNLLQLLKNRLSMWRRFEKQLENVQQSVQETDYMVELLTLQGSMDFDRLKTATDRLKDLHDSADEREELIRELKRFAEPLISTCNPEVKCQLNAQVDEAVTAWNDTRKNLCQIVNKYENAVKLWKNYREARDDIRTWIDQQWHTLDLIQDQPEESIQQIKEFRETLASQKARLDELKKLVDQIAADIGLGSGGLLECEVEDLGKRLKDVKETLTTLTSVAELRTQKKDVCKDELVKAKTFLNSVQKSLNVVGEDGNENTLSTLRDHLLALGKTESQVQNVKEKSIKMNEKPHEIKSETSVVEILELWQQVFRETFQQYYRLSAKLVRSQDGAAALQLWQEYLRHVQTFLAGSLPEDYDGLRETQRLCEVHQNLLTSQQSVLSSRKDDPAVQDFSQALQEQFNSLANLHNETLTRIMDRHNEVNKRLTMWDTYRFDQSKLLAWLRDMTRDQSRLQLRYIHLRRLPKLLEQIDILLAKIPQGKSLILEQQKQQEDIVKFCDEALAVSIKMETVATAERINNLEASLKSWKDFLNRVKELYKNYESELEKVEKVCDEVTNKLTSPAPLSFSAVQSRLDLCQDLRNRISKYAKNIEEANVIYDQLKESLSPHDMKMLSQRLWLMGQRQGDLEHHLLLQILWLEDRLETQQAFNLRHARFLNWANDLIKRFDKHSSMDPTTKFLDFETRAKRLEAEVQIELSLKNRELNALHAMANNIIDLSKEDPHDKDKIMPPGQNRIDYEIMKSDVERKIKEVDDVWEQLKNLKCVRLERKSKLQTTMNDLWKRMEDLKLWLVSIEEKLEAPSVIEKSSKKCVDKLIKEHEIIQEEIEKQSGNVGEVLNLCELFLADPAVDISGIDTNEFESTMQALEKRWKSACLSSTDKKGRILGAWELLLQLSKICKEQEKWITEREKAIQTLSPQSDSPKLSDVQKLLTQLDKERRELDSKAPALKILDASYSKLAQESRLPTANIQQLAGPAKALISRWHNLYEKLKLISDKLGKINKLRDDFIRNQNSSIVLLTNISAKLMQAELLSNPKKRLKEVNKLEKELEMESGCLKTADETGLELMRTCPEPQNVSATQKMVDEYQVMWKELKNRFADIKNKSLENLESKEIQVSTLAFDAESEVQVDTLPHMDRLTSRDAYGLELDVALKECNENLKGLEKILEASEGESGAAVPTHKTLAKIIATCISSVELVQHLNQTLIEDCGMNDTQARTLQVNEVSTKFQELVARARKREKQLREASERGRLTCPICSRRNWQQLENDLWRLDQWIQYAEAIQSNRPSLPSNIEALEDVIQSHRELLIDLDSHKSIIVSLNIVGDHLADHVEDADKARSLRERLRGLNLRWDNVCSQAAQWQGKLQEALIENPEFHDTIGDLVKWLENTEAVIRNSEPVDLAQDRVILESQYKKFKALSKELERCEPRVQSLQEAAVQLLDRSGSARERLNVLRLRLTGMRRLLKVYLLRLGAVLGSESIEALDQTLMTLSQEMLDGTDSMSQAQSSSTAHSNGEGDIEMSNLKRGLRYLGRVFKASLPIQALMLLLLGAAALVPDEYYSCAFSNNARFQSYYPNGPPPI